VRRKPTVLPVHRKRNGLQMVPPKAAQSRWTVSLAVVAMDVLKRRGGASADEVAFALMNPSLADAHPRQVGAGWIVVEHPAEDGPTSQLVRLSPGSGAVQVLTNGNRDTDPDLSPDGRLIAFERCVKAERCDEVGTNNIWLARSDGTEARPLTMCDGSRCLGAFDPAFAPDRRHLAFAQDLLDEGGANVNGIFVMRSDGRGQRRLTSRPDGQTPDGHPSFSPDGRKIVFVREVEGGGRLMVVNTDGSGLRPLLPGVNAFDPVWSPDGRRIAFTLLGRSNDQDVVDVATVKPDGTHLRRLTHEPPVPSAAFQPDYSPRGRDVVFSESDANGCRLVVAHTNGTHLRQLPTGEGCFFNASWGTAAR
jgi:Tol biopolymer transport system component